MFIGNSRIVSFFDQTIAANRLGQVYCFSGPEQLGKRTLALKISAQLLGSTLEKLATHPDFFYLERGVDEKTGKARKEIAVSQARRLRSFLQNQSWNGGKKVVIIEEAETLNEESGNALLKSLEEAGEKCNIFLLTANDEMLLPTIKSRVQLLNFVLVDDSEIEKFLFESGCDQQKAKELSLYSGGRPGRVVTFLNDDEQWEEWKKESIRWRELWQKPLFRKIKELDDLFVAKEELVRTQERLNKKINIWVEESRRMLLDHVVNVNINGAKSTQKVIDSLRDAKDLLGQNINPKMLIEKIMLQF